MKKIIFVLFTVVLSMTLQAASPWDGTTIATAYAGGTGALSDPYIISTPEELAYLASVINATPTTDYTGKYFNLTSDLDLNSKPWTPIGSINRFKGTFDGKSHVISNLNVNVTTSNAGLFGSVQYAFIKNLGIVGTSTVTGAGNVGGIVGQFTGYGAPTVYGISGCFSNATVSGGSSTGNNVGGIVGSFKTTGNDVSSLINNCYTTGSVSATGAGANYVSGIVGRVEIGSGVTNTLLTISNSYSSGSMTATGGTSNFASGIAKLMTGVPLNVTNCYYLKGSGVSGAQLVTAADMITPDFITALNLSGAASIWKADFEGKSSINNGFPILTWRNAATAIESTFISKGLLTIIGKTVKFESPSSIKNLQLYNFSGQLVETKNINYAANNISFDVQHAGIYMLIAQTAEGQLSQKIIVK